MKPLYRYIAPLYQQHESGEERDRRLLLDCLYNISDEEALEVINLADWMVVELKKRNPKIAIGWLSLVPLVMRYKQGEFDKPTVTHD